MNKQKWALLLTALVLIGGGAGFLAYFRGHQKLGAPGVTTRTLPGTNRLEVLLPEHVLDYESQKLETDSITMNTLPPDTGFGQCHYQAPDGFQVNLNVVLMGGDRTSLHKPQFCLDAQGWKIDDSQSLETKVRVQRPYPYDLPVVKLVATKEAEVDGQKETARAIYVYWYVADGSINAGIAQLQRMWWMARDLLRTGVWQRWAYVSCLAVCRPGQEEAAFDRLKKFIADAAPQFQLTPSPKNAPAAVTARQ